MDPRRSGVIQFRRPISSCGPHGLFETFRPSFSKIASGTSSGSFSLLSIDKPSPMSDIREGER